MKKILLFLTLLFAASLTYAQLPYSKMLNMDNNELIDTKFKYNKEKNQYVLTKKNGWNQTANVISAINGATVDVKLRKDDYVITRQEGKGGVSFLNVIFYHNENFHTLQEWIANNVDDVLETNSGKITMQKFNYDDLSIRLETERVGVSATTGRTSQALVKSIDESYNVYRYTVSTGIAPFSKWHEKEASKKEKRDEKGKKKDVNEL